MKTLIIAALASLTLLSCTKSIKPPGCIRCRVTQVTYPNGVVAQPFITYKTFCGQPYIDILQFQQANTWHVDDTTVVPDGYIDSKVDCWAMGYENSEGAN